MVRLLTGFAWLLVASAALVVGATLFFESSVKAALSSAVPSGVLLALAGHLFTQAKSLADAEEKRSKFNLEGFVQAFSHANSVLSDGNNSRALWIEAARSLAHGKALAKGVTVSEHKRVLELERLKFRGLFHAALAGKPASFFYGVPPLHATLEEAAMASSRGEERDGRVVVSTLHELDEAAIRAVWFAASWPKDYSDPSTSVFAVNELGPVMLFYPELHRFLEHRRNWGTAAGKLFPRKGT